MGNAAIDMDTLSTTGTGLPNGWRWTPLGEVADNLDNKRKPINAAERETRQGDVPYYGATGQVGWIDKHLLDEEVVLVGEDGAPFLEPGRAKAYMISGKSWVNNHAHVLRTRDGMPNAYLMHFLNILDYAPYVSGTTRLKLTKGAMGKIPVPVAPLPEQRRIVSAIETQLGRLDAAVARLYAAKAKLKRYKQAVLKAAVENTGFETEEELGSLAELVTSGSRGWAEYYAESGDIFIRAQNLKYDALDFDDIAYVQLPKKVDGLRTQVQMNDILITITGANVTKTALVTEEPDGRAFVNQHIALVRMKDPSQAPFVFRWIISPAHGRGILEKLAYGAGKPGLNLSHIRDLSIPIPSPKEQAKAVAKLEAIDAANDELEATLDAQLLQSTRLRQAVLKRAFEGRLV
jgi:type I restriction enzyme S subunit